MEIKEIIKESFEFPSKNLGTFSIYTVLTVLVGSFAITGMFSCMMGLKNPISLLMGLLSLIIALILAFPLYGYSISVVKSGIKQDSEVPEFEWKENFYTGINNFVVTIVYMLIPTIIVLIVGLLTNVHGNLMAVEHEIISQLSNIYTGSSTAISYTAISAALNNLANSLIIPVLVAIILFAIFIFLKAMAEGRLANTGSLNKALNLVEVTKDIKRIGAVKAILVILSVFATIVVIEIVLSVVFDILPILSNFSILISPYLLLFSKRAVGLLYSDIA